MQCSPLSGSKTKTLSRFKVEKNTNIQYCHSWSYSYSKVASLSLKCLFIKIKSIKLRIKFLRLNVSDYIVFTHHMVLEVSLLGELPGTEGTLEILLL